MSLPDGKEFLNKGNFIGELFQSYRQNGLFLENLMLQLLS
jgi:hypothetical protein